MEQNKDEVNEIDEQTMKLKEIFIFLSLDQIMKLKKIFNFLSLDQIKELRKQAYNIKTITNDLQRGKKRLYSEVVNHATNLIRTYWQLKSSK